MKTLWKVIALCLPWPLKRWWLQRVFGYELDPTARIGLAWVFPHRLVMHAHARIDHLTVAIHLDYIEMGTRASIGRSNWITGLSAAQPSRHFRHQPDRRPWLTLGPHAAITKNHHLDCTHHISIGAFTTVAGYHSQLLTHAINLEEGRQDSAPIHIGQYCFVATNVVILGGSKLPDYSVLGAKSLLNKAFEVPWRLYAGVPAANLREISKEARYFSRPTGFVE